MNKLIEITDIMARLMVILEGRTDRAMAVLSLFQECFDDLNLSLDEMRQKMNDHEDRITALELLIGIERASGA